MENEDWKEHFWSTLFQSCKIIKFTKPKQISKFSGTAATCMELIWKWRIYHSRVMGLLHIYSFCVPHFLTTLCFNWRMIRVTAMKYQCQTPRRKQPLESSRLHHPPTKRRRTKPAGEMADLMKSTDHSRHINFKVPDSELFGGCAFSISAYLHIAY